MQKSTRVSVIVPTKNSQQYLARCLASIKKQKHNDIEIIVVDNNSSDKTKAIARKYTNLVFNKGPERSSQRNFGVRKSHGEFVVIIDSDMVLATNVISQCVNEIQKNKMLGQIIIPEKSLGIGFWATVKAHERSFYVGDGTIEAPRFFVKKIFLKAGGYDERIRGGGEEYDLPDRITEKGYKTGRITAFITHLEGNLTLLETTKTKYYYGKTAIYYLRNHPKSASKKFNILRPVFFKKWDRMLLHPILTLGMVIMKFCEFGAGAIGMLRASYEKYK